MRFLSMIRLNEKGGQVPSSQEIAAIEPPSIGWFGRH